MNSPPPEHRRVKITTDIQSNSSTKLQHLGPSHPFIRQVDILFPSSDILESALCKLSTRYAECQVKLADVVHSSGPFADFYSQPQRCFAMLSNDVHGDDVWCIDPRGLLTLLVTKDTYERLGLVGRRLPFKAHKDYFVIRLPLQKNAESVANVARRNEALKAWDARREREGLGAWNVVYNFDESTLPGLMFSKSQVREVVCQMTKSNDVHIPLPSLRHHPSTSQTKAQPSISDGQQPANDDDVEDWNLEMAELFEWVGMASLGSQRLKANDRVDPYVALYEYPSPSHVGNITRLRWSGLIGSTFLQSVIDIALATMKTLPAPDSGMIKPFVAITAHSCSTSPVTYIPPSPSTSDGPTRLARVDGEDTWCLFATSGAGEAQGIDFALVESLGQYDTRWG
ncbi:hypothetical protein H2248_010900 [Termitomyces sp. 'cryptogamus']|nr:hypothetical protein H2248_010900 [Termitomyces sp. 'cryptogamus']